MYLFSPCFLTLSQLEQMWGLPSVLIVMKSESRERINTLIIKPWIFILTNYIHSSSSSSRSSSSSGGGGGGGSGGGVYHPCSGSLSPRHGASSDCR